MSSINGPRNVYVVISGLVKTQMVRVDKKAFMRVQWPKAEPGHLPRHASYPLNSRMGYRAM